MNAGFLLSEDCKTLYVRPPLKGQSTLSAVATTSSVQQCPSMANLSDAANQAAINISKLQHQETDALDKGNIALLGQLGQIAPGLKTQLDSLNTTLGPYALIEAGTASMLLSVPYSQLIAAYAALNPTLAIQRLPIKGGFLTVNLQVPDPADPTGSVASTRSATLSVRPIGTTSGSTLNAGMSDFNIASPDGTQTINFGDSASGQIRFSMFGICPFYDKTSSTLMKYDFSKRGSSLGAYLGATYTYFYPVQTKGSYTITFDADYIANICQKIAETHNGDISATALAADIFDVNGTQAFKITLTQDLLNSLPSSEDLLNKCKADVTNSFVNDLLSKFGDVTKNDPIPDVDAKLTGFRDEARSARHCHSSGFLGLGNSCSDDVYTVRVPINTLKDRAKQVLGNLALRYSVQEVKLTTVILIGTEGFDVVLEP
jgi:hypothetical protein